LIKPNIESEKTMSKDETEQNKTDIVQPHVGGYMIPYGYSPQEDEICLIDYVRVLVKLKSIIIIFGLTAITIIGAVLYAILLTPVYKAEAVFLPPTYTDIQALNILGVHDINSNAAYSVFIQYLLARDPRHTIFEKMNLLSRFAPEGNQHANPNEILDNFNQSLTVTTPNIKKGEPVIPTVTFTMKGEDPVLIAEIVNRITKEAERVATATIISEIQAKISYNIKDLNREINQLRVKTKKLLLDEIERIEATDALDRKTITDKISSLRNFAKKKRLDRIAILKETAGIAHSLGINDFVEYRLNKIKDSTFSESAIIPNIFTEESQSYARGFKAIEAEMSALLDRTSDDPFIPELRGLQAKLKLLDHNRKVEQLKSRQNDDPYISALRDKESQIARLESIHIDPLAVTIARLDQAAYPSNNRIKPNRRLIVILGFAVGLMFGIFGAFFCNFLEAEQKKKE